MYVRSAQLYDRLYAFKDYGAAVRRLHAFVHARRPAARTLLDVACGTGRHLALLQADFEVEGLDLNPELLARAAERLPGVPLHEGDMTSFDLGRRFDVVTCLFSSIAYVRTHERMRAAVACMARHVAPGGLLLVEPWFSTESYWTGRVTTNIVDDPDLKVVWMYVSERSGTLSVHDIHYLVGTSDGVDSFRERHELGLFSPAEYERAMTDAGLAHEHDVEGFFGRGLHAGTAPVAA
jgi:SAM-dependent methyltransferase